MISVDSYPVSELPTILLVDDNVQVLASLGVCLEFNQFQVWTATTVDEALRLISTESFDVLLCDLHMPRAIDGLAVVTAMQELNAKTVILLLSGDTESGEIGAFNLNASEVLVKPIAIAKLVGIVRERLGAS
jgi:DNA-binding response OmpR family regulator